MWLSGLVCWLVGIRTVSCRFESQPRLRLLWPFRAPPSKCAWDPSATKCSSDAYQSMAESSSGNHPLVQWGISWGQKNPLPWKALLKNKNSPLDYWCVSDWFPPDFFLISDPPNTHECEKWHQVSWRIKLYLPPFSATKSPTPPCWMRISCFHSIFTRGIPTPHYWIPNLQ